MAKPLFIVIGGPNGAGKSTAAAHLIPAQVPYLNADEIAKGLANYPSQSADMEASRILLTEIDALEAGRESFAMETTLSSRSLAPRIKRLRGFGYEFRLAFAYLPSPEMAVLRVAGRVRLGGHDIPEATIHRRCWAGLSNFFELHRPLADRWYAYNTTSPRPLRLIASGGLGEPDLVEDALVWRRMQERNRHE